MAPFLPFMLRKIYDSLLALTYPQVCRICEGIVEDSQDGVVCGVCWDRTHIFNGAETTCHKCQKSLIRLSNSKQTFCRECDKHYYDLARAVGIYEYALSMSVLNMKREPMASKHLKRLLCEAYKKAPFENVDFVVPVPLSRKRLIERGFNQASILAKLIAADSKISLNEKSLLRIKHSKVHRAGMDKKRRSLSVKNSFKVKNSEMIKNKKILLVDDVFTSGATVSNCAKALKKAGAKKVYVFTIARAI